MQIKINCPIGIILPNITYLTNLVESDAHQYLLQTTEGGIPWCKGFEHNWFL
jgi:hypothetical protein